MWWARSCSRWSSSSVRPYSWWVGLLCASARARAPSLKMNSSMARAIGRCARQCQQARALPPTRTEESSTRCLVDKVHLIGIHNVQVLHSLQVGFFYLDTVSFSLQWDILGSSPNHCHVFLYSANKVLSSVFNILNITSPLLVGYLGQQYCWNWYQRPIWIVQ